MSANKDRMTVFPSQANLTYLKVKTESAIRGLGLLRKKRDTLQFRLREIKVTGQSQKALMPISMREAIYSLNRAKFLGIDLYPLCLQGRIAKAEITVKIISNIVAGVQLPTFKMQIDTEMKSGYQLIGLGKGGQALKIIRDEFRKVIEFFLELASLLYAEKALQDAVNKINTRTNALEYIVIPKFRCTVNYVRDELEELAREEFYRLKKAQASHIKRQHDKANQMKEYNHEYNNTIKSISTMNWTGAVDFDDFDTMDSSIKF